MNQYAFLTKPARRGTGFAIEGVGKGFSLIIRANDGSTLLETHVDYMHQAFQRLIDWSINETCQDVCAVITGPNGFYKKHRIKASRDFEWTESKESVSEASVPQAKSMGEGSAVA